MLQLGRPGAAMAMLGDSMDSLLGDGFAFTREVTVYRNGSLADPKGEARRCERAPPRAPGC